MLLSPSPLVDFGELGSPDFGELSSSLSLRAEGSRAGAKHFGVYISFSLSGQLGVWRLFHFS
jgi:hypothetical protein